MKAKWGSCNHKAGNIRLNTELVKKSVVLIKYVALHEMLNVIEPTHNKKYMAIHTEHYRTWIEVYVLLNALLFAVIDWKKQRK